MVALVNKMAFILACVTLPYFFLFFSASGFFSALVILPIVACYLGCIALNHFRWFKLSKFLLLSTVNIGAFYYSAILGEPSAIYHLYYLFITLPFILFDFQEIKLVIAGLGITFFSWFFLQINYNLYTFITVMPLTLLGVKVIYYCATTGTFILAGAIVYFYFQSREKIERQLQVTIEDLNQSNLVLKITMTELTESLKLQAEMKSQTEFARLMREIAHEVKNPLHLVSGNAAIVADMQLDEVAHQKVKRTMKAIMDAVHRIDKIVNAMMRYGDSRKGFESQLISVSKLLDSMKQLAMGNCRKKGIALEVSCPEDLTIFGDDARIGQALINLISNAIQYTPTQGVLSLSAQPVTYKSPEEPYEMLDGVCIVVKDTGCGIPQDKLDKIFSPAVTSHNAAHNFGMGLAIVFQTVTESKGMIKVESTVGKGTTFMLYLPSKPYDIDQGQPALQGWSPETEVYALPEGMF